MRIEIWTDVICPWCGIGEHRLTEALHRFGHGADVEVVHRSFQLDPRAPLGTTETVRQMLKTRKRLSDAQVDGLVKNVERVAAADGLAPYVVGDNHTGNTSLAHELAAWATEQGRGAEIWARLYTAYFGEARSIFDVDSLVELARELGLDTDTAREVLTSRRYEQQVLADGREAQELGASGVPFIVIDRRYAIAGAQPVATMLGALEKAWTEQRPTPAAVNVGDDALCGPDGCALPQ